MKSDNTFKFPVTPSVVWIDLDDTLIDFRANSREALALLYGYRHLNRYHASAEEWIEAYEKSNHDLWDRYNRAEITKDFLRIERMRAPLRDKWTGTPEELDRFARDLDPLYLDFLAMQKKLVDGAMELLEALRGRGFTIGVLSNGFKQVQYRKMESAGLSQLIDHTVLSDDIGVNKPALPLYRHAMARTGVMNPGRHLMIGDNLSTDIHGAVNAGWDAVYFNPEAGDRVIVRDGYVETGNLAAIPDMIP